MNLLADRFDAQDSARTVPGRVGPILYLQGSSGPSVRLSVLMITMPHAPQPALRTQDGPVVATLVERDCRWVLRYAFDLPMRRDAWYEVDGERFTVNTAFDRDLRIAYVSCNGQEHGDRRRDEDERNVLWRRLARQHDEEPFQLLLHGGDQVYADELVDVHPLVRQWMDGTPAGTGHQDEGTMAEIVRALGRAFFRSYMAGLSQPETSWLMARIPSLAMWDDHDICDGWGSMRTAKLESPIGQSLFAVARENFVLFQLGAEPGKVPDICLDPAGASLSWHVRLPGLHLIAPDLRSERRPDRVMGDRGWRALEKALSAVDHGRVLLLSSVPPLGPRLSWVEAVMHLTPGMEKYEDDLRDQWQSRAHRAEWRRFLERLAEVHANRATPVTLISGEIHLATRGTFDVPPAPMHQLVASGIAHPAPPTAYAKVLGALARFGESPVPGRAIRLHPLPGRRAIYAAQRNYLVLERRDGDWRVWWELERDGATPALRL